MGSRQDDAEDEDRNVIDYCVQLSDYSLTPGTNTKYATALKPCDGVNSSPNTLQAIFGERRNENLHCGRRTVQHDSEQATPRYTWSPYFGASRMRFHTYHLQDTQTVHALRTTSDRKDDVEDEHGNVIEYCGQLFRYSLTPGTNTKCMTTIEPCRVNISPTPCRRF